MTALVVPDTTSLAEDLVAMAAKGHSIAAFKAKYRLSESQLQHLIQTDKIFREAVDVAKCAEYAFWESQLLEAVKSASLTAMSWDEEDGKTKFSNKDKANIALNMMKHQSTLFYKIKGKSLSDAVDDEDPIGEFGVANFNEDITRG